MKVVIETILNIEGNRGLRRADFFVKDREFKNDSDFAVAVVAYEWIQQQKSETGYRETIIEKVTWNDQYDITEIVRQIQPLIPEDTLPF